jgi:hypothetical protein
MAHIGLVSPAPRPAPCAELIAPAAAQITTIMTATMSPYVRNAPTIEWSGLDPPTAPEVRADERYTHS